MSKTLISVVVVAVVVVGGYYLFLRADHVEEELTVTPTNEQETESTVKKMAFSEFVKQGGAYKCDVKQAMSDFENSGTVYISGGNTRGEYTTIAEGRTMKTSFILKDGYSYSWGDMMQGMGFKVKATSDMGMDGLAASDTYSWNANQIGDYTCEAWTVDSSKFDLPSGVTFRAVGASQ